MKDPKNRATLHFTNELEIPANIVGALMPVISCAMTSPHIEALKDESSFVNGFNEISDRVNDLRVTALEDHGSDSLVGDLTVLAAGCIQWISSLIAKGHGEYRLGYYEKRLAEYKRENDGHEKKE